jgi:negative regulator of flagellin synthesis FlgM
MQIHGTAQVHSPQPVSAPHRLPTSQPTTSSRDAAPVDQLDISPEADLVSRVREIPDIRSDRVAELREAIQSGNYETEAKLNLAVDRLFDEVG